MLTIVTSTINHYNNRTTRLTPALFRFFYSVLAVSWLLPQPPTKTVRARFHLSTPGGSLVCFSVVVTFSIRLIAAASRSAILTGLVFSMALLRPGIQRRRFATPFGRVEYFDLRIRITTVASFESARFAADW
jgi:hypothetical protein